MLDWNRLKTEKEMMETKRSDGLVYLTFLPLEQEEWLTHCFTTRLGGVSQGIYESMNFREDADDPEQNVRENYRRIARTFHMDVNHFVRAKLVHGNRVHLVTESDYGEGTTRKCHLEGYDGLMTDIPGVMLVATFADCVPLYFADPVHRAIALSHSGWRGTVGKIGKETVLAMQEAFGSRPEELTACIGPCICQECYVVGEDVAEEFTQHFSNEEKTGIPVSSILSKNKAGKFQLNLRKANEAVLLEAGIRKEQIHTADLCTCCNPEYLFSHRATKGQRGNLAAFLGIRS